VRKNISIIRRRRSIAAMSSAGRSSQSKHAVARWPTHVPAARVRFDGNTNKPHRMVGDRAMPRLPPRLRPQCPWVPVLRRGVVQGVGVDGRSRR